MIYQGVSHPIENLMNYPECSLNVGRHSKIHIQLSLSIKEQRQTGLIPISSKPDFLPNSHQMCVFFSQNMGARKYIEK